MNVREIVADWLKAHGYDGLYWSETFCDGEGCGCTLDDLMPCEWVDGRSCVAGYCKPCSHFGEEGYIWAETREALEDADETKQGAE